MKLLPLVLFGVAAISGCANQPTPVNAQSVGESQKAPAVVAQCIAQKWADQSQRQVVSQVIVANNQAMDVYVPGQQPPNGAAAVVRPSWTGNSKTWVGFRAGSGADSGASGSIGGCL